MNFRKKFLIIFLLTNLCINIIYISHFEVRAESSLLKNLEDQASGFISKGLTETNNSNIDTKSITTGFMGLGQILTMVGAGVMIIVTTYMGIKYIMSPPDKQAALKQQLIGVVVAGVVIFGAFGIWKALVEVLSEF